MEPLIAVVGATGTGKSKVSKPGVLWIGLILTATDSLQLT